MSRKNGGTAFPITVGCDNVGEVLSRGCEGMTMRDYFAAHAIAGVMLDNPKRLGNCEIAEFAYCIADAMLTERDKG